MTRTKINVIADTSAGYKADGKSNLQRNIIRSVISAAAKEKYSGIALKFFAWSDGLTEFSDPDEIAFSHSAESSSLASFIDSSEEGSKFLLLSDGLFDAGNIRDILREKNSVLVPVAVGADSDIDSLRNIAAPDNYCFGCVNVLSALFEICFRNFCTGGRQ